MRLERTKSSRASVLIIGSKRPEAEDHLRSVALRCGTHNATRGELTGLRRSAVADRSGFADVEREASLRAGQRHANEVRRLACERQREVLVARRGELVG